MENQEIYYTDAQICGFIIITFFEHSGSDQRWLEIVDITNHINNKVCRDFESYRTHPKDKVPTTPIIPKERIQKLLDQMPRYVISHMTKTNAGETSPYSDIYAWCIASGPDGTIWETH